MKKLIASTALMLALTGISVASLAQTVQHDSATPSVIAPVKFTLNLQNPQNLRQYPYYEVTYNNVMDAIGPRSLIGNFFSIPWTAEMLGGGSLFHKDAFNTVQVYLCADTACATKIPAKQNGTQIFISNGYVVTPNEL